MSSKSTQPIFYFRISSISRAEFCSKASKILTFNSNNTKFSKSDKSAIATGNKLHNQYSNFMIVYRSFDSDRVKHLLNSKVSNSTRGHPVFKKQIDDIVVAGMYDNLIVLEDNGKKYTELLELKSTSKKKLSGSELRVAIRQLQLYMWLLKDYLEEIGYPLYKLGYIEVVSQVDGRFIQRVAVQYDDKIEEWIRNLADTFKGIRRMNLPKFSQCKECFNNVKQQCEYYKLRKENKGEW